MIEEKNKRLAPKSQKNHEMTENKMTVFCSPTKACEGGDTQGWSKAQPAENYLPLSVYKCQRFCADCLPSDMIF